MLKFYSFWFSQSLSVIATNVLIFTLSLWVYEHYSSVTKLGLTLFFGFLPSIIVGPLSGPYIDRLSKKWVLVGIEAFLFLITSFLAYHAYAGSLTSTHVYIFTFLSGIINGIQLPTFQAMISHLVNEKNYSRAASLIQFSESISMVFTPLISVFLTTTIGIEAFLGIVTGVYLFSALYLTFIQYKETSVVSTDPQLWFSDLKNGLKVLMKDSVLVQMCILFGVTNFCINSMETVLIPLVIEIAGKSVLANVLTMGGICMAVSSILLATIGLKTKLIPILAYTETFIGFLLMGSYFVGVSIEGIAIMIFIVLFFRPVSATASQTIWLKRVAPSVQGCVFTWRRTFASIGIPFAYLVTGPILEKFLSPLVEQNSFLGVGIRKEIDHYLIYMSFIGVVMFIVALNFFLRSRTYPETVPEDQLVLG